MSPDRQNYSAVTPRLENEPEYRLEAMWFAGAYEAGGTMGISVSTVKRTGRVSATPYLFFQEKRKEFISYLQSKHGGSMHRVGGSWRWSVASYPAAEIVIDMAPYLVSRQEMALAIENWVVADTPERVEIGEEMRGKSRIKNMSPDDYLRSVRNPVFIAGMIDNRGSIYQATDGKYVFPAITIRTKNWPLIEALRIAWGGDLKDYVRKGQPIKIGADLNRTASGDSFRLALSSAQARNLIEQVEPYLKLPPYEKWDERKIDNVKQGRLDQSERVRTLIIQDLEDVQAGRKEKPFTIAELGEIEGVHEETMRKRLTILPEDLLAERESVIRHLNHRVLSRPKIQTIVKEIQTELENLLAEGETDIPTNRDLAKRYGLKLNEIIRNIIPELSQDLRARRLVLIRSQSAARTNRKRRKAS